MTQPRVITAGSEMTDGEIRDAGGNSYVGWT
jgi:hypothetical protein